MQSKIAPVITIDGPGGVGKGTVAHLLAKKLNWHILDSGAIYRVLAFSAEKANIQLDDCPGLLGLINAWDLSFQTDSEGLMHVYLNKDDVSERIRYPHIGTAASELSVHAPVREALLACQRGFRIAPGLVADGRDMGTVVFPQAELKIFLDASAEARALRRHRQLIRQGINVNLREIFKEILDRDTRDRNRTVAPLQPAQDAINIDTTELSVDEVFAEVVLHWHACQNEKISL